MEHQRNTAQAQTTQPSTRPLEESGTMEWASLLLCGTVTARFQDGSTALLHPSGVQILPSVLS